MKVLLINTSEFTGGAAVAANRLMAALDKSEVEVNMIVRDKQSLNKSVISINSSWFQEKLNKFRFIFERLVIFICNGFSKNNLFKVSIANTGVNISHHPLVLNADIIHLHWINQGFLSLSDIHKLINLGKPIVWTMHDLWSSTGICHYPGECIKYTSECKYCPMIKNNIIGLSLLIFREKKKIGLDKIHFVGCSKWICNCAMKSSLLPNINIVSIPNPIDIKRYFPLNKENALVHFGLDKSKIYLLFGAAKLTDERKGASFLKKACSYLQKRDYKRKNDIEILLMGNASQEILNYFPYKVHSLGYLSGDENIVWAYRAADVFVIPSLEDNLPNTIMEAMASGTPCVGFETGGIPEMIDHKINGYLAKYKDANDLALGIQWILENSEALNLSEACVKKVKENYEESVVAQKYISLYKSLLS